MAASAYYLLSATLVIFISDAIARLGPRAVVLIGAACMGTAVALLAAITAPWQLFAAYLMLATGAAAMHTGAITTIVGLWFDRQRGLAISLALNGASFGGILVTPALVIAIERFGFAGRHGRRRRDHGDDGGSGRRSPGSTARRRRQRPRYHTRSSRPPGRAPGRCAVRRSGASPARSRWR